MADASSVQAEASSVQAEAVVVEPEKVISSKVASAKFGELEKGGGKEANNLTKMGPPGCVHKCTADA